MSVHLTRALMVDIVRIRRMASDATARQDSTALAVYQIAMNVSVIPADTEQPV